jgi:protein-S-isoprenylcysteine O-methyltransferase Ste14
MSYSLILPWLGGLVFMLSLGYTAYFFIWVLGDPPPPLPSPLPLAATVDAGLFALFAAHHSLCARAAVKRRLHRVIPPRFERSAYVWTASLLLLGTLAAWQLVEGTVYRIEGAGRWLLHACQLAGVYLTFRGAGAIDPLELAGIRQAAQRAVPLPFRTDGPFTLVRHPIYLGWILMTFAVPHMTVNRLLFASITTAYLLLAIPWEETALEATFGDRYRSYRAQVRWRILPGVW